MPRKATLVVEPALEALLVAPPTRKIVPVASIRHTQRNPRGIGADAAEDLDGLTASLESTPEPNLVQTPSVQQVGPDAYVVIVGDRRVRAVRLAGWQHLSCDVYTNLDPLAAHDRGVLENLQRKDVHPLDEADSLGIAWLSDNARALGIHAAAVEILSIEQPQAATITQLTALLDAASWARSRPKVTQMATLKRFGLTMNKASLKKLMRLLSLSEDVKATARQTNLTAAAMRSLGTLAADDQLVLVRSIQAEPGLATRVRRIARKVTQYGYPLERALSEARGQVWMGPQSEDADENAELEGSADHEDGAARPDETGPRAPSTAAPGAASGGNDRKGQSDAAMKLLEGAGSITAAIAQLRAVLDGQPISSLAPPWDEIVTESLGLIQQEVATLGVAVG